jgi:hypothetical protein
MRYSLRHFARAASLVAALLTSSTALFAQDCPECVGGSGVAEHAGSCGAGGGNYNCFQPLTPCQGKACYPQRPFTEASQPDVFFNLYQPNNFGAAAAAYPAPYPTPNWVGHTYYTYQPLMPHEFLYHHHRTYHQYYNGGMGLNRTTVHWYGTPVRTAVHGVAKFFSLPR